MKSELNPDRMYIECACGSPDHLLTFEFSDDREEGISGAWVSFTSENIRSWKTRLKWAWRYLSVKTSH
jgi:hypothetical protein